MSRKLLYQRVLIGLNFYWLATSILYSDDCPQNASGPLVMAVAETVVQQLSKQHDNHILEGACIMLVVDTLSHSSHSAKIVSD